MKTKTKQEADFIKMIANRLAEKFLEPLILPIKEKNYYAGIGGLAEILDWSVEFYHQYYDKIIKEEIFKHSNDHIPGIYISDSLIVAFGEDRLKKFYATHLNHAAYFLEKYSAIVSCSAIESFNQSRNLS